ncbi:proton-coupled folate transporter-like [Lytechinus variegatus]|uniref:proton-coupled folate transporter-like n=1 Tax=Lytechinus variegatus TaxID=7654 RepID=UPI001BB2CB5B|nr:proton-coupled folate transporter-like [Lytechinus variegatus]
MEESDERSALYDGASSDLKDYASHEASPLPDQDSPLAIVKKVETRRTCRCWITVEFIVILVAASYGGISTLGGQYIRFRVSSELYGNATFNGSHDSACDQGNSTAFIEGEIQKITSKWTLYLTCSASLPSIFTTLLIGTLSQRYGRRVSILLPCLGFLGECVVKLLVINFELPLGYLFVGSIFCGLCGNLALFMTGCFTYITDITTEKDRMIRIVVVEILIFVGIAAMQICLGYMIHALGFALSLWVPFTALVLSIINAGTPCLLEETITDDKKRDTAEVLKDIVRLFRVNTDNRLYILIAMLAVSILVGIVIQGGIAITVLYGQGQPFCWGPVMIGYFVTISLVIPGIGTVAGAGIFQRLKLSYMWIVQVSIISGLANTLALAFTFVIPSTVLIFASTFLGLFKLLGLPVIRTFLSTVVQKNEHGALFAALGVLDGLSAFLATPIVNGIYYATIDLLSTVVFFVMSALLIIPIIITGVLQCKGLGKVDGRRPLSINTDADDVTEPFLSSDAPNR